MVTVIKLFVNLMINILNQFKFTDSQMQLINLSKIEGIFEEEKYCKETMKIYFKQEISPEDDTCLPMVL